MLVMLTCAMGVGPIINLGLGSVSALIIDDLGISAGQFGLLSALCFSVAALGSVHAGRLSDRISERSQIIIIFGGSAGTLALASITSSFAWLLVTMALSGLSQSMGNPTTNRLSGIYAPPGKQAGWIGVKQSGQQAAQFVAGLSFPALSIAFGWRGAAAWCAFAVLLMGVWAWALVPRRLSPVDRGSAKTALRIPLSRRVIFYAAQAGIVSIGLTATNVYLPLFAVRELGFSVVRGGALIAVVGVVGATSRILWARSLTAGRGTDGLLVFLAAGAVAGSLALMLAGQTFNVALLWVGTLLHGAMALGVNVVVMAGVMREVEVSAIGRATGAVSLGLYAGIAAGPLIMGTVLDLTNSFVIGWAVVVGINLMGLFLALGLRRRPGR